MSQMKGNSVLPNPGKKSNKSVIQDYFENSSITGYSHLVAGHRIRIDRILWVVIHVTAVLSTAYVVGSIVKEYNKGPTITTQASVPDSLADVPFPAIAICDINRISKAKATQLAKSLIQGKIINKTLDEMVQLLVNLGEMYTLIPIDVMATEELHEILQMYSIDELMRELSPSCEFLQRCKWQGKAINCRDIFSFRKTQIGYCCTFNYLLSIFFTGDPAETDIFTPVVENTGRDFGLSVLFDSNMEDDFFPLSSCDGVRVYIFNPRDFPDSVSGGLIELPVAANSEVEVSMDANTLHSFLEVKDIAVEKRNCLFNSELSTLFDGFYSYSNCVVICRVADMMKLCACQLFYLPPQNKEARSCQLIDLPCLRKYSGKWLTVLPKGIDIVGELELDDVYGGLSCPFCYPTCSGTSYKIGIMSTTIGTDDLNSAPDETKTPLKRGVIFKNHSILHIFFDHAVVTSYKQEVLYSWYDFLSNCGSIFGLVMGLSFISIIEILYYIYLGMVKLLKKQAQLKRNVKKSNESPFRYSLYWSEINPKKGNNLNKNKIFIDK